MITGSGKSRVVYFAAFAVAGGVALGTGNRVFADNASNKVIRACVNHGGDVRIVEPHESCKHGETLLTWNVQGPQGPTGPAGQTGAIGPIGPAGPEGTAGRDGRDGRDGADGQAPGQQLPTVVGQMKVDGLTGINASDATPIIAFSLGATNSAVVGGGAGGGAGKAFFQDVSVAKLLDGFSVPLLKATATGQHIQQVQIETFGVGSTTPFATYTFRDVLIHADVISSSSNAVIESLSFDYGRITSDINLGGQIYHTCFDVSASQAC